MIYEATTQEHIEIEADSIQAINSIYNPGASSAISLMTVAFSRDPVARWMYADASEYLRYFPEFVRAFAGRSFEKSAAYLSPDSAGAALWLPPDVEPDIDRIIGLAWASTTDGIQRDLFPIFEQMANFHPKTPHWYLPMIGVDGLSQGKGVGASLMKHAIERVDADGLPAYLESSNPRNISLYKRFGFEVIGTIKVGDAPPLYPMLRPSQRTWDEELFITRS